MNLERTAGLLPLKPFGSALSELVGTDPATLVDVVVLVTVTALALFTCWLLPAPFFASELAVYAPALLYLILRCESVRATLELRFLAKSITFCAVFYTYVGIRYEGWTGPSAFPTILGVPVEQAMWGALVIPLSIALAQRFFAAPALGRPLPFTRLIIYSLFTVGLALALIPPLRSLMDGYVYLKIGVVLYPLVFLLAFRLGAPLLRELFLTGLICFALHLCFELLAIHHGYWAFEGEYVGWVHLGGYEIPLEEFVFIILLSSPTAVAIHALRFGWKDLPTPSGHR